MIKINIEEIDNGFNISLFTTDMDAIHDKTVYRKTWKEVLTEIQEWRKSLGLKEG